MSEKKRGIIILIIVAILILLIPLSLVFKNMKGNNVIKNLDLLFESAEMRLLYIGSSSCRYCQIYSPILDKVSDANEFDYYYIDMEKLTETQYNKVIRKIGKEGQDFGTPYTALISSNKIVGEIPGFVEEDELIDFLIEKNFLKKENVVREETSLNMIDYSEYNKILEAEDKEIIVFAASSCSYCIEAKPILNEIAKEHNLKINYFNIDKISDEEYYEIQKTLEFFNSRWGTPTTVIVESKEQIDLISGLKSKEEFLKFFTNNGFLK